MVKFSPYISCITAINSDRYFITNYWIKIWVVESYCVVAIATGVIGIATITERISDYDGVRYLFLIFPRSAGVLSRNLNDLPATYTLHLSIKIELKSLPNLIILSRIDPQ